MSDAAVPVDGHRQDEDWSCGPAALKILLSRFGHNIDEQQLIDLSRSGPAGGTTHEGLVAAARSLGYRIFDRPSSTIEDVKAFLDRGLPVLVDFQGRKGGHFAVVVSHGKGRFTLEDPREVGAPRYTLDENVFRARWYNVTYPDGRVIQSWLMAVEP